MIAFILLPTLILSLKKKYNSKEFLKRRDLFIQSNWITFLYFFIGIIFQLVLNKLNAGVYIPVLDLTVLSGNYHVINVGFFGILLKTIHLLIAFLIFNKFFHTKKAIFLIMFIILILMPLTRLSRIDIIVILFTVIVYYLLQSKNQIKPILLLLFLAIFISIAGAFVADYRWSAGGLFDVSFADTIEYTSIKGPYEVLPFLYAYFSLSLENIDRFVILNENNWSYSYGAFMLRPILVGIFKLHHLEGFPFMEFFGNMRNPLVGVATVPTALPEFAVDFGIIFSIIPMIVYSMIGVFLYLKVQKQIVFYLVLYSFYSYSYFLLCFQNTFISPTFLYILILLLIYKNLLKIKFIGRFK